MNASDFRKATEWMISKGYSRDEVRKLWKDENGDEKKEEKNQQVFAQAVKNKIKKEKENEAIMKEMEATISRYM